MYLKNYLKLCKIFLFFVITSFNIFANNSISQEEDVINAGKKLFEGNCAVCHAVHEQVIGPALSGVYKRRPIDWIYAFVKNSQKVIHSGDAYAVKLYEKYGRTQMTSFEDFSNENIDSLISYIKYSTDNPPVVEAADNNAGNVVSSGGNQDMLYNSYMTIMLVAFSIILLIIICILFFIIKFISNFINKNQDISNEDKEFVNQKVDFKKAVNSYAFKKSLLFLTIAIVVKSVIDGLFSIGIQQGYAPRQPIAFSHQLHAGQYQIECQYCHTGVMKSKNANIPSANICMNCHSAIKKDSTEIKKIYFAIENNIPIEWVRVHNLPKLAYFNHAQHVKVGGLECQNCHGAIEEMEVIYQHAPLTMGWCIACHRNQEVNANGNEYYDQLMQVHSSKNNNQLKVRDIGGLECGKCHY